MTFAAHGAVLLVLILAFLAFFAAGVASAMIRAWWAMLVCIGLALFVLAFVVT